MASIQDALNIFKKFRYFIDLPGGKTIECQNAPDGWLDTTVEYVASKTYNGLVRTLASPMKFVRKDAKMLRQQYALTGLLTKNGFRINQGDGRNNYTEKYKGVLDYSQKEDTQTGITIPSKTADFSQNIDAYDSTPYLIDLNDGVMVELPPLALAETATMIFNPSPDFRSDAYFDLTIGVNQSNSINQSVQNSGFFADSHPMFNKGNQNFFFIARADCQLLISGNIQSSVSSGHYQANIYKSDGSLVKTLVDVNYGITTQANFEWNFAIPVVKDDRLFFYFEHVDSDTSTVGFNMQAGTMNLSYYTSTPATMCKALRGEQIFSKLLQAMNVNTDSSPNLPVTYQSFLLSQALKPLVMTCSDSIRQAEGSIYRAGDTLFTGVYKVISGSVSYNGGVFPTGSQFTYTPNAASFTGTGIVQKLQSIFTGAVYNIGDTLQAGGTYLVEGTAGTLRYNNTDYAIGDFFKYVLGQTTFTATDLSIFVKQTGEDPQISISFADFYQAHKSIQGGSIASGVQNGIPYLEDMSYIYRAGIGRVKLGNVGKDWKSTPAVDLLFNTIDVGYTDQQYDAINGVNEVNTTQTYTSPLLTPATKLNLVSPVRADPYGIEQVRVSQQDSSASRSDNDNFFIWLKDEPETDQPFVYYRPKGSEAYLSISGVDPSYYNYDITPKQNLYRGDRYLASIFYNMRGRQLTLSNDPKNRALVTIDLNGRRVSESDPLLISNLPKPLFIPEYYSLKQGFDSGVLDLLDSNPYADLQFVVNGVTVKAFINDFKVSIGKNQSQDLKLLLTPDNNLNDFVRE